MGRWTEAWLWEVLAFETTPLVDWEEKLTQSLRLRWKDNGVRQREMGFHRVAQAGRELLTSGDPPASASQSFGQSDCGELEASEQRARDGHAPRTLGRARRYHKRVSPRPFPEPNLTVCEEVAPSPQPFSAKPRTTLRPHAQKGKANTLSSNTLPSRSCSGTTAPIYRLVPPAGECHGDNRLAPIRTAEDPARTRGAVLGTPGSHYAWPGLGWH
ncbi:hypothetical protein AAY473_023142 [Plecturocebus cupreus]